MHVRNMPCGTDRPKEALIRGSAGVVSQTIHVWKSYIYIYTCTILYPISDPNVGNYSIHGWSGYGRDPHPEHHAKRTVLTKKVQVPKRPLYLSLIYISSSIMYVTCMCVFLCDLCRSSKAFCVFQIKRSIYLPLSSETRESKCI